MNLDKFNELLLESVGVGLAILQPESLQIMFLNRRLSEWFPEARAGEHPGAPPDVDRSEGVGLFFERNRLEPAETVAYTSHAAALAAAAAGEGIAVTLVHSVATELSREVGWRHCVLEAFAPDPFGST